MNRITVSDRQATRKIDRPAFRRVARFVLEEFLHESNAKLAVHLVDPVEMADVNERFLQHAGSTDVISFDYTSASAAEPLQGEIFICVDEAVRASRRYRCPWPTETVRYLVHGLLHLKKYDDLTPGKRRVMKREENRILREVCRQLPADAIHKTSTSPSP